MLDLTSAHPVKICRKLWFSDIFYSAIQQQFSGKLHIQTTYIELSIFFQNGSVTLTTQQETHSLGQLVVQHQLATVNDVQRCLEEQASHKLENRPRLGQLLRKKLGLSQDLITKLIKTQSRLRILPCFGLTNATSTAFIGKQDNLQDLFITTNTLHTLIEGILKHSSDEELRHLTAQILGQALSLKKNVKIEDFKVLLSQEQLEGLRYLDRPRKPDQLERAIQRKNARPLIRLLQVLGMLECIDSNKAIPITKTLRRSSGAQTPVPIASNPCQQQTAIRQTSKDDDTKVELAADLKRQIEKTFSELSQKDDYQLLGVTPNSDENTVYSSYTKLIQNYHPDRFFGTRLSEEIKLKIRTIYERINQAHKNISKPTPPTDNDAVNIDQDKQEQKIQILYHQAEILARQRKYSEAQEIYKKLVELVPDKAIYKSHFAWTILADKNIPRDQALNQSLTMLKQALALDNDEPTTHLYLGRLYIASQEYNKALRHLEKAAELNPRLTEAVRESRLLRRRIQEKASKKSQIPFGGLFGQG